MLCKQRTGFVRRSKWTLGGVQRESMVRDGPARDLPRTRRPSRSPPSTSKVAVDRICRDYDPPRYDRADAPRRCFLAHCGHVDGRRTGPSTGRCHVRAARSDRARWKPRSRTPTTRGTAPRARPSPAPIADHDGEKLGTELRKRSACSGAGTIVAAIRVREQGTLYKRVCPRVATHCNTYSRAAAMWSDPPASERLEQTSKD